jgi:hypothetical protein
MKPPHAFREDCFCHACSGFKMQRAREHQAIQEAERRAATERKKKGTALLRELFVETLRGLDSDDKEISLVHVYHVMNKSVIHLSIAHVADLALEFGLTVTQTGIVRNARLDEILRRV